MEKSWQKTDIKRNEMIVKKRADGNYSLRALGKMFKLSRTRIKAILDRAKREKSETT